MRILEKYVLKSFVESFLFCILLLMVLGVLGDVLGFIDDIFKHNIPLSSIISFYFYLAPFAFVNMVPFACLLGAVYVFNGLSKNREVTAVIASGVSLWKLLRPVLIVTFLLCMATFIVNDRLVPSTMEKANYIRRKKLTHDKEKRRAVDRDITFYGKNGQMIYAQYFDRENDMLQNVTIHRQHIDRSIKEKINARTVRWREKGYWLGEDVIVFKWDYDGTFAENPEVYQRRKIPLEETPEDFLNNQNDPRFMSYLQLRDYIQIFRGASPQTVRRLRVDLNYKLAFPFTALVTVLVGVPFSISTGRASALIGMAKGIAFAIAYLPLMAVSLALGKGGLLSPVVSAWLSNGVFALAGIYFVNRKS